MGALHTRALALFCTAPLVVGAGAISVRAHDVGRVRSQLGVLWALVHRTAALLVTASLCIIVIRASPVCASDALRLLFRDIVSRTLIRVAMGDPPAACIPVGI